jgi:hypothetical protein
MLDGTQTEGQSGKRATGRAKNDARRRRTLVRRGHDPNSERNDPHQRTPAQEYLWVARWTSSSK